MKCRGKGKAHTLPVPRAADGKSRRNGEQWPSFYEYTCILFLFPTEPRKARHCDSKAPLGVSGREGQCLIGDE